MTESALSQVDADALLAVEKHCEVSRRWIFPTRGGKMMIPLVSHDRRENFLLDFSRGTIELRKVKLQTRARQTVILARVDLHGPAHLNPDGEEIPCPHIHVYREGFGDRWAFPLSNYTQFRDPENLWETLENFYVYCNVTLPPNVLRGVIS